MGQFLCIQCLTDAVPTKIGLKSCEHKAEAKQKERQQEQLQQDRPLLLFYRPRRRRTMTPTQISRTIHKGKPFTVKPVKKVQRLSIIKI